MTHRQRSRCQRTREADLDEYLFTLLLSYDVCSENTPVTHVIRGLCNTSFTWVTHLPACMSECVCCTCESINNDLQFVDKLRLPLERVL